MLLDAYDHAMSRLSACLTPRVLHAAVWGRYCCSRDQAALPLSRVLPHYQLIMHHDVAAAATIVSSLHCTSSPVGCCVHMAMLTVATPLMALRCMGHAGRERVSLSASTWTWVSTVAPTTSSQGAHTLSHWPYPTALSLFLISLLSLSHAHVRAREWSPLLNSAHQHLCPPIFSSPDPTQP